MQVIIHVMTKSPQQSSLRELIVTDLMAHERDSLVVISQHTKGRPQGWAKIKRTGSSGALNIEWDADTKTLVCRVVGKAGRQPNELVGSFVAYLLEWHGKRVRTVTIHML